MPRCALYMVIEIYPKRGLGDGSWQIFRRFKRAIWGEGIAGPAIGSFGIFARVWKRPHVERTDSERPRLLDGYESA